jgi:transposase
LIFELGLTQHQVAASVHLSQGVVSKYLALARAAGLTWPRRAELDDLALERLLFPRTPHSHSVAERAVTPQFPSLHEQLKKKGVTLHLLWQEYRDAHGANSYEAAFG